MSCRTHLVHHTGRRWKYLVLSIFVTTNLSLSAYKSCRSSNRILALLNSLLRSTLARTIAVSHTVFLNEDKFPRFFGFRGELFISFYRSALTGPRFPAQALVNGYAKVPSLLYYDKTGNVRAAGVEVLTESVCEAALTEKWTRAESLVINDVKSFVEHTHP